MKGKLVIVWNYTNGGGIMNTSTIGVEYSLGG